MRHQNREAARESKTSRREALKGMLAAGITGVAITGAAAEAEIEAGAGQAQEPVTTADIAVSDRVAGRNYSETERQLMTRSLGRMRGSLRALRNADLIEGSEPATHFDPCLPGMRIPQGKGEFHLSRKTAPPYDGNCESLAFATAVDLGRLLKARKITSAALTRMYLERLKKFGPRLRCVVNLTEELALQQAERADREIAAGRYRGPLHGVPWGAKDLLATKGIPTTWGAKPYENQGFDYNATVVERLEAAGAVLVAKLSMGELAMGDVWFGGMTRNPWRPVSGSSGSSAGPGSATAAGLVGFAIGTETLGSIVSPSVVNGVTGLRPTYGRVSRHGAMALCWTMDKIGPMARSVEDCAAVLNAIYGPDGRDSTVADAPFRWNPGAKLSTLRVGIPQAAFDAAQRDALRGKLYMEVLETLRKLGVELHPITLPKQTEAYSVLAGVIIDVESSAAFAKLTASGKLDQLASQSEGAWPNTFRVGSTIPAADYLTALRVRRRLQEEMAESLKEVDCYVTPPFASLTQTNLTGHPTLVTRCGLLDGLPVMVEFTGALYREDAILRLGLAYEQATPHHRHWPDTEKIPALE